MINQSKPEVLEKQEKQFPQWVAVLKYQTLVHTGSSMLCSY